MNDLSRRMVAVNQRRALGLQGSYAVEAVSPEEERAGSTEPGVGTITPVEAASYLKRDGSRSLTGNLSVATAVTIDGVDISVHAANVDAHHAQVHAASHHLTGADELNHDNLAGFVGAEHLSLPNAIANVLSDHNKAVHDALGLSHDSLADVSADDHHAQLHAAEHVTGGSDVVANAIAAGASGLMTGADKTKLNGVEALADVTDFTNVQAALAAASGAIAFNAQNLTGLGTLASAAGTLTIDETASLSDYLTAARGDMRYYTETELDAGQLDNRYYTETEEDVWRAGVLQAEMDYLDGVTSDIQDQLDARQPLDATLTAFASLLTAANKIPYATNVDTGGELDLATTVGNPGSDTTLVSEQGIREALAAAAGHAMLDGSIHTDSVADAVTRGSIIYGNATPKWDELVVGAADTFLGSDGTDVSYRTAAQVMASLSGAAGAAFNFNSQNVSGINEITAAKAIVQNLTFNTTTSYTHAYFHVKKTAGVTDAADVLYGNYTIAELDQVGGVIGNLYGGLLYTRMTNGTCDLASGQNAVADLNGGTINTHAIGLWVKVDQEPANTVGGDIYGIKSEVDADGTVTGSAYMLYLAEGSNINYGIYQDGTALNVLGGQLQIQSAANLMHPLYVRVNRTAGSIYSAMFFTDGNNTGARGIQVQTGEDVEAGINFFFYALDGDGAATGYLLSDAGVFAVSDASDVRLKKNIKDTDINGRDRIMGLKVRDFEFIKNPGHVIEAMFVADEVENACPNVVSEVDGLKAYSRDMMVPTLVKHNQEIQLELDSVIQRLKALEN